MDGHFGRYRPRETRCPQSENVFGTVRLPCGRTSFNGGPRAGGRRLLCRWVVGEGSGTGRRPSEARATASAPLRHEGSRHRRAGNQPPTSGPARVTDAPRKCTVPRTLPGAPGLSTVLSISPVAPAPLELRAH